AVGADAAGEGAVPDVDRRLGVHLDGADRGAAEIGSLAEAAVVDEPRVDDLEPAALVIDRAAAAAGHVPRAAAAGVPSAEGQVLHDELRVRLVVAVVGGPLLALVTGVHVQDPALPRAA